jgi:hypothetical protein
VHRRGLLRHGLRVGELGQPEPTRFTDLSRGRTEFSAKSRRRWSPIGHVLRSQSILVGPKSASAARRCPKPARAARFGPVPSQAPNTHTGKPQGRNRPTPEYLVAGSVSVRWRTLWKDMRRSVWRLAGSRPRQSRAAHFQPEVLFANQTWSSPPRAYVVPLCCWGATLEEIPNPTEVPQGPYGARAPRSGPPHTLGDSARFRPDAGLRHRRIGDPE